MSSQETPNPSPRLAAILIVATLGMAICGLIYELLAGALSSYLIGNSIAQFSIVIGWFLTSMGIGSWISRFVTKKHLLLLFLVEISIGFIGGHLALIGFFAFAYSNLYQVVLLGTTGIIGILVGLEIPLIFALLKDHKSLNINVANILSVDYIGALVASLLFPFVLIPHLGLNQAGLATGLANLFIAFALLTAFKKLIPRGVFHQIFALNLMCILITTGSLIYSEKLMSTFEKRFYRDPVVFVKETPYQRVVLTKNKGDTRLYLNGHLQFSSRDEYRYHETLVHIPAQFAGGLHSVLILGGGDGMAVRELLKHSEIQRIVLVDLDPEITSLFREQKDLLTLNEGALNNPKVQIINRDAFQFLQENTELFDLILADLPDPSEAGLSKLYSKTFYTYALQSLRETGVFCTQSTSTYISPKAYWSIHQTLAAVEIPERTVYVAPLQLYLPSFGFWGFQMAAFRDFKTPRHSLNIPTKFLDSLSYQDLQRFPKDLYQPDPGTAKMINKLNHPIIVELYTEEPFSNVD